MAETSRNKHSTPKKKLERRQELPKLERQKHRAQKYRPEWEELDVFKKWLKPGPNEFKAKCFICDSILTAEIGVLKMHANRQKHLDAMKMLPSTSKQVSTMASFVTKKIPTNVQNAEVKLTGFLVEHNLAFKTADHLTELLKSIFPDSKIAQQISLKRTKATAIATAVIGETEKEVMVSKLKQNKFSVICDESTDISTQKASCIVVRFRDEKSKQIVSKFWELMKIFDLSNPDLNNEGATGKNLFNALIKSFEQENVPLTNLIGFAADGCSVMMGENNSVSSRLKEHCRGIVIMKCVCHSAHLCASSACKELPRRCEDLAREIYAFFKSSSKRQCQFAEFQEFLKLKPHKMLHLSQTRWLSLVAVVERILEQWDALKLFFTNTWLSEKLVSTEIIFNNLNDPFIKLYFNFLAWILPKFTEFNKFFQSENVVITSLNDKIHEIYRDILLCFLKRDYVMKHELESINFVNEEMWLRNEQMYSGVRVMNDLKNLEISRSKLELNKFFSVCRNFLVTSAKEIKKRYRMNDPLLSKLHILHPANAASSKFRESVPSIFSLIELLPRVVQMDNMSLIQNIDNQWRNLPAKFNELDLTLPIDKFWSELHLCQDYRELSQFALDTLCIPHSNAQCERVFSHVNLMKTKIRNKLLTKTVNGTLLAAQHIKETGSCIDFKPSDEMLCKLNLSMYKRINTSSPESTAALNDSDSE
ncbi:unnamed protein product [Parnassius mnemosyne]|uniref:HAT C-terminal dimerisation domain-containing protein n=1 Tax=Parnassius mnemosyne TaxID=213953 RepID=A0AAV1KME1_9NEOP